MAKGRDRAVVDVIINNEEAKKKARELTEQLDEFSRKRREALKKGDLGLAASFEKECGRIRKDLKQYKTEVADVRGVLLNLNKVSFRDLSRAHRAARAELQGMRRDSEEYLAVQRQVQQLEREMVDRKPAKSNNRLATMLGGAAIGAGLQRLASNAVEVYQRVDDKMADVQKTTGLAKEEVAALDRQLQKIDTRTSREDMLDLARVAGQLGIEGVENIEGFVRAADKIRVALGEDLGGDAETAIREIGKLTDIFHIQQELGIERSYMAVGSAINSLGAASTAKESFLVEFTKRVAGTAPAMGVSIQQALGLGATLDQLGQTAEVSGTAYGQVMSKMRKDTDDFARIAGMSVKDFRQLMETDANEAFIKFLEGLGSADATERIRMIDSLGLSGQRTSQVLGTLADNTALLREQQALSDVEFAKATSLTEEFNTKNESAAAIVEKHRKAAQQAMADLGEKLFPLWSQALGLSGGLLRILGAVLGVVAKYSGVIITLTVAIVAYNVVEKARLFWSQANRAAMVQEVATMAGATAGTKLLAAAKLLLVGNLKAAGTAFKMFWASIGPVGWAVTAIAGLVAAFQLVRKATEGATTQQRVYNDVQKRAADIEDEHGVNLVGKAEKIKQLMRVVEDETTAENKRITAVKELQSLIPNGVNLINQETIANGKAAEAVKAYTDQLILQATVKAALQKRQELIDQAGMDKVEGKDKKVGWFAKGMFASVAAESGGAVQYQDMVDAQSKANAEKYERNLNEELAAIDKIIDDANAQLAARRLIVPVPEVEEEDDGDDEDDWKPTGGDSSGGNQKWRLDRDEEFMEQKIALRQKMTAGEIATEEEFNRQLLALETAALQQRINANIEKGAEMQVLQASLADKQYQLQKSERDRIEKLVAASLEGKDGSQYERSVAAEKNAYEKRLRELGLFGKERAAMTAQELAAIENLERNHTAKLQSLYMDQLEREFKTKQAAAERELNALRIQHTEQLEAFTGSKQAAKRLRVQFDLDEQALAKKHLQDLLAQYQAYMVEARQVTKDGAPMFNEAEVQRLQEIIDELQKKLAGLKTVKPERDDMGDVDILGFTQDRWESFFENLKAGEMGIRDWQMALQMVGQAFSQVSELMSAAENREFKNYEKAQNRKKKALDARLKNGQISEAQHASIVEQIDEELDRKKAELERKQAMRERALKIFEAMTNTAVGITAALKMGPIIGPILAAVVGALGAVQIAAIAAAPLPGAEDGGYLAVTRAQDGKRFRAKDDPDARGFVDGTRVIVSENGEEYVATAAAVRNPTIRPVLDVIDLATRNGTVGAINLPEILATSMPGRAGGGYVGTPPTAPRPANSTTDDDDTPDTTQKIIDTLARLDKRFERPLKADTHLVGKGGIQTAEERFKKIRRRL